VFLVLQHARCQPPGVYEDVLEGRGLGVDRRVLDVGDPLPETLEAYDGMVVMGGHMGAYAVEEFPWLRDEIALLAAAVDAGLPVWGVCLGAQLLAAALGAEVRPGPAPEIGVLPVTLTEAAAADPVFGGAPPVFRSMQWHGDTYDLPAGATRLAGSGAYAQQAFVHGRSYGVQFHLEVDPAMFAEWAARYRTSLESALGPGAEDDLREPLRATSPAARALAGALFARWLDLVVAPATATRTAERR
jgi:GMP synthase-like glutamine amidotransferase